jgi:hypothetical protein
MSGAALAAAATDDVAASAAKKKNPILGKSVVMRARVLIEAVAERPLSAY